VGRRLTTPFYRTTATSGSSRRALPTSPATQQTIVRPFGVHSLTSYLADESPLSKATSQYIEDHLELYQNPNVTVFSDSKYSKPKNSMAEGGCG